MEKIYIVATVVAALGILLVSSPAVADYYNPQNSSGSAPTIPNTTIPGEIFTGDYLRIGINPGGTLGVGTNETNISNPGVGFQWAGDVPFALQNSTESVAIWWWGEGYKIAYKEMEETGLVDTVAFYQPGFGYPPPIFTNITPISETLIINDTQKAIKEIKVMTNDKKIELTFTFTFLKQYPELNLETTITNIGREPVRDVVYTRIVDWDVCTDIGNMWASTGHEAYAWDNCYWAPFPPNPLEPPMNPLKKVQLTIAGHDGAFKNPRILAVPLPIVNYVDLYSWDDSGGLGLPVVRSPLFVVQSFMPIGAPAATFGDYNAGIYYKIGELERGESATVYTVYQSNFPLAPGVTPK